MALALLGLVLAMAFAPSAQARVESIQSLASSPVNLTALAADPGTGLIYGQANGGTAYYVYDPRTNAWTERAPAPINSGNNGGAAYLGGKIYTAYTSDGANLGVYDIASNSWTTIKNPLEEGTGDIAAGGGKLYLVYGLKFVSYDPATGITAPLAESPKFLESGGGGFDRWGGLQVVGGKVYGHQGNGKTGFAVYDIVGNSWQELPYAPKEEGGGLVLGSAFNPLTDNYLAYGPYSGKVIYRFDIEAGAWKTNASLLPFIVGDGGLVYVGLAGYEGVYLIQGESGTGFARYTERNQADLSPSASASVRKGGRITYSIEVKNNGPERAGGVVLSDQLPKGAKLLSAASTKGSCAGTSVVTCDLGLLLNGASAKVTIEVKSRLRNSINAATVSSYAADGNSGNDGVATTSRQCVVPKLKTRSVKAAKKALRGANCKPGKKIAFRYSGKVDEGKVIRGSKGRGSLFPAGKRIKLTVSLGPKVQP